MKFKFGVTILYPLLIYTFYVQYTQSLKLWQIYKKPKDIFSNLFREYTNFDYDKGILILEKKNLSLQASIQERKIVHIDTREFYNNLKDKNIELVNEIKQHTDSALVKYIEIVENLCNNSTTLKISLLTMPLVGIYVIYILFSLICYRIDKMDQRDLDKKASSEALDHIKDNQILAFQFPNETESPREVTKFLFNQVRTIAHNFYINLKNLETNLLSKISKPSDEYILSIELCKTHLAKRDESKLFRDLNLHGLINGVKDSFNQFHYSQIDNLSKMYIKNLKSYKVKPYDPANSTEYKALCLKRLRMGSILLSSFLLIKVLYG